MKGQVPNIVSCNPHNILEDFTQANFSTFKLTVRSVVPLYFTAAFNLQKFDFNHTHIHMKKLLWFKRVYKMKIILGDAGKTLRIRVEEKCLRKSKNILMESCSIQYSHHLKKLELSRLDRKKVIKLNKSRKGIVPSFLKFSFFTTYQH